MLFKTNVLGFLGDSKIEGVKLDRKYNDSEILKLDAVFEAIGHLPNSELAKMLGVALENNLIAVDSEMRTNVPGVYAAGSCIKGPIQIAKSAGDGCKAGISIIKKLKRLDSYLDQT